MVILIVLELFFKKIFAFFFLKEGKIREFSSGPVVRTLCVHCCSPDLIPPWFPQASQLSQKIDRQIENSMIMTQDGSKLVGKSSLIH